MIVTLAITGGGQATLSAGGKESPQNLRVNGRRITQVAEILRAAASSVFDRKNLVTRLTFDVTKTFDSIEAAEVAVLGAAGTYCFAGIITFRAQGAQTFARTLTGIVESVDAKHLGIAATFSFSILGGALAALPNPPTPI